MTVLQLYEKLCERIPTSLSAEWDNDGAACLPEPQREVRKVVIALDPAKEAIALAAEAGADVILTHHPLLFRPVKRLEAGDPTADKLLTLVRSGMALLSFHTRLDAVEGGVNDTLCRKLGISDTRPFGPEGEAIGRIGRLAKPVSPREFAAEVKEKLEAGAVQLWPAPQMVQTVAVLGGSGGDFVRAAKAAGADLFLCGEAGYHHGFDAVESGMSLLTAGHYETEQPVTQTLAAMVHAWDAEIQVEIVVGVPRICL